ncbi:hypothetical protein Ciccas_006243 [Cichlidogyrus casuarinus]|uniref:Uncharacterized protein n=1 Tax=Cichlidogyrus casuarinus TaxID=1844966 RepID=A0ABD2Q7G3_9PLAT
MRLLAGHTAPDDDFLYDDGGYWTLSERETSLSRDELASLLPQIPLPEIWRRQLEVGAFVSSKNCDFFVPRPGAFDFGISRM